jgi:hypothetical protein
MFEKVGHWLVSPSFQSIMERAPGAKCASAAERFLELTALNQANVSWRGV